MQGNMLQCRLIGMLTWSCWACHQTETHCCRPKLYLWSCSGGLWSRRCTLPNEQPAEHTAPHTGTSTPHHIICTIPPEHITATFGPTECCISSVQKYSNMPWAQSISFQSKVGQSFKESKVISTKLANSPTCFWTGWATAAWCWSCTRTTDKTIPLGTSSTADPDSSVVLSMNSYKHHFWHMGCSHIDMA